MTDELRQAARYRIAGFDVDMNCTSSYMRRLCRDYLSTDTEQEAMNLCYQEEDMERYPQFGRKPAEFEYNYTLYQFAGHLVERKAFCFHASALSVDGEGILFSADSGTGKSTHARLWKEYLKDHKVINLNDDKPMIRLMDGRSWAWGAPWSGKHSIHANIGVPVKALVFLEQGEENRIERLRPGQIFPLLFPQVIRAKSSAQQAAELLELLDQFVRGISVYRLRCNISEEAVRLVYDTVWERKMDDEN